MSATGDQHPKPERENQSLCLFGHAGLSHLYVYVLDYIPHKTTAVPLFLALSFSHRICRASHESILPAVSWCPGHPPRQEYFPISGSSRASAQLAPPSVDTSTRRIPYPESKATPSISVCIPGCKISLGSGRTNMERTLNLLIGTVSLAKSFGDSVPFGALGMRYALSVQKLLKG